MTDTKLCRKRDINESTFYKRNKKLIEVGKKFLFDDETREATSDKLKELRTENDES
jgi:ssDNA-specific exonuclease RecJ